MKISIIGAGVTGQATGIGLAKHGNNVIFYDIDKKKLAKLKQRGYRATWEILKAVCESEILFICVPTPTVDGQMDFSYMRKATINIARVLGKAKGYRVLAVRSTVLPSTTRCKIAPLLEKYSKLKAGQEFGVCMNPEFLREQYALQDFLDPSRIVIGELDKQSGDMLEKLYAHFNAPIFRTDLDSAEMIKYAANCFLATKISFFNEVHMVCQKLGLDSSFVSKVTSLDPRIGSYGIHGGRPFSGKCLPKDLEAFISHVKDRGINPKLLEAVSTVNKEIASFSNGCAKKKTQM